jgi:hypothetical protein
VESGVTSSYAHGTFGKTKVWDRRSPESVDARPRAGKEDSRVNENNFVLGVNLNPR